MCVVCPKGKYSANDANHVCSYCPNGKSTSGTGTIQAAACSECTTGKYSNALETSGMCEPCPEGKSPFNEHAACKDCALGKSSPGGLEECILCEAGTYQSGLGKTACIDCPVGKISTADSTSFAARNKCDECDVGTYNDEIKQIVCKLCEAGTDSEDSSSYCGNCVAGKASDGTGKACASCLSGTYSSVKSAVCAECAAGYSTDGDRIGVRRRVMDFSGVLPFLRFCVSSNSSFALSFSPPLFHFISLLPFS